jgi:hypothetical protein
MKNKFFKILNLTRNAGQGKRAAPSSPLIPVQAARKGKSIPKLSRVYEENLMKGWEAIQRERKRGGEK